MEKSDKPNQTFLSVVGETPLLHASENLASYRTFTPDPCATLASLKAQQALALEMQPKPLWLPQITLSNQSAHGADAIGPAVKNTTGQQKHIIFAHQAIAEPNDANVTVRQKINDYPQYISFADQIPPTNADQIPRRRDDHSSVIGKLNSTDMSSPKMQTLLSLFESIKPAFEKLASGASLDPSERAKFWRKELDRLVETKIPAEERQSWTRSLNKFESRCKRVGIPDAEKAEFFANVVRLIRGADLPTENGVNQALRVPIAKRTIEQAARPSDIAQGDHSTCACSSMENLLATCNPGAYARLIADLALTGKFGRTDKTLTLPKECLTPDSEARDLKSRGRSFPSQLVQQFLANLGWADGGELANGEIAAPGTVKYRPVRPGSDRELLYHNGKAIVTTEKDSHGRLKKQNIEFPNIDNNQYKGICRSITGADDLNVVAHKKAADATKDSTGRTTVRTVKSLGQLQKLLEGCAVVPTSDNSEHKYHPPIVRVHTEHKLLGDPPGKGEWHAAVLREYNPKTKMVTLNLNWGHENNFSGREGEKRRLHISEVYKVMQPPAPPAVGSCR